MKDLEMITEENIRRIGKEDKEAAEEKRKKFINIKRRIKITDSIIYGVSLSSIFLSFFLIYKGIKFKDECAEIGERFVEKNGEKYYLFPSFTNLPCYKFSINNEKNVYLIGGAGFVYPDGSKVDVGELKMLDKKMEMRFF